MSDTEKWIWLSLAVNTITRKAKSLISCFGSIDKIYTAPENALKASGAISEKDLEKLLDKDLTRARAIVSECEQKGIRIISPSDEEYPERLWNISNPPVVLYARGDKLDIDKEAAVAVVGTRRASEQGENAAKKIGREISQCGGVVVTGLARGIDSLAAKGALGAGGKVIAVLGNGVDVFYPKENKSLYEDVAKSGTLISEYPPRTEPTKDSFPRRNRIMSGISLGAVIVEAPKKSGALITASLAIEQDRDVFAVPSGIFESAGVGSNELIRDGAIPVMSGLDVMAEYEGRFGVVLRAEKECPQENTPTADLPKKFSFPEGYLERFSEEERFIIRAIAGAELSVDEIAARSGFKTQKVLALLTLLEIRGSVKQLPGARFKIKDIK